jgi:TRAP-type C4-dicarboxylate transport system permease small subunit
MISAMTILSAWKLTEALNFDTSWGYLITLTSGCFALTFTIVIYFRYLRNDLTKIHDYFKTIMESKVSKSNGAELVTRNKSD